MFSSASFALPSMAWAQTEAVTRGLVWPNRPATTGKGVPWSRCMAGPACCNITQGYALVLSLSYLSHLAYPSIPFTQPKVIIKP